MAASVTAAASSDNSSSPSCPHHHITHRHLRRVLRRTTGCPRHQGRVLLSLSTHAALRHCCCKGVHSIPLLTLLPQLLTGCTPVALCDTGGKWQSARTEARGLLEAGEDGGAGEGVRIGLWLSHRLVLVLGGKWGGAEGVSGGLRGQEGNLIAVGSLAVGLRCVDLLHARVWVYLMVVWRLLVLHCLTRLRNCSQAIDGRSCACLELRIKLILQLNSATECTVFGAVSVYSFVC